MLKFFLLVVLRDLEKYGQQSETMSLNVAATLREAGLLLDKITAVKMIKQRKLAEHALK